MGRPIKRELAKSVVTVARGSCVVVVKVTQSSSGVGFPLSAVGVACCCATADCPVMPLVTWDLPCQFRQ